MPCGCHGRDASHGRLAGESHGPRLGSLHGRQTAHFSRSWLACCARCALLPSINAPPAGPTTVTIGPGAWDLFFRK